MRSVYIAILLSLSSVNTYAACAFMCNPAVSKPCGKACISNWKACHKPFTIGCSGVRTKPAGVTYENPIRVEASEYDAKASGK